jgi:PKD repeat protein
MLILLASDHFPTAGPTAAETFDSPQIHVTLRGVGTLLPRVLVLALVVLATLPPPASASHPRWGIEVTLGPAQTKAGQSEDFTVTLTNSFGDLTVTIRRVDIRFGWDAEPQNVFTGRHNIPPRGNQSWNAPEVIPLSVTPGTYSATVNVTAETLLEPCCSSHDWILPIEIVPNLLPTASFWFEPKSPAPNGIVSFFDNSTDPDGSIVEWQWDFGDGTISTEPNPIHAFAEGDYRIVLSVRDNNDGLDEENQTIRVSANLPPRAGFSYSLPSENTPMTVQFSDGSSDPDGSVVGWHWDFGDGTDSTERDPSHRFPAEGAYAVVLTVTDDEGAKNSFSSEVVISVPSAGTDPRPSGFGPLEWGLIGAILASTSLVAGILIKRRLRPARRWGQTSEPPSEEPKRRWRPR